MDLAIALVSAGSALAGAVIGALSSQRSARTTAWTAERLAKRQDEEQIRRTAAKAYVDATVAVEWLSATRIEDSTLQPFREIFEPEFERRIARLRQARDALAEIAALVRPLGDIAGRCAYALGQLDEAWREGRYSSFRYHEGSGNNVKWYGDQLTRYHEQADALRERLLGVPVESRAVHPDVTERSGGMLLELRDAIGILNEAVES